MEQNNNVRSRSHPHANGSTVGAAAAMCDDTPLLGNGHRSPKSVPDARRVLIAVHVVKFLSATAIFMQVGVLPFLSKSLGADPIAFGYLQTCYATLQFLGGPFFGRYGDQNGSRAALLLALVSAALTFATTGFAYNLIILFLAQLPGALTHTFQGCQMVVTDISTKEDRADAIAKLGVSFGLGMVVGPTVGGFITRKFGERSPSFFSFVICIICLIIVWFVIPRKTKKLSGATQNDVLDIRHLLRLMCHPKISFLLIVKIVSSLPSATLQATFAMVAMESFSLTPEQNGYFMSLMGLVAIFVQAIGIRLLISRWSDTNILMHASFAVCLTFLTLPLVDSAWSYVLFSVVIVVGLCVMGAMVTSLMTKAASHEDTGAALGLNSAIHSLVRVIGPVLGGYLIGSGVLGMTWVGWFGFICHGIAAVLLITRSTMLVSSE